MYKSRTFGLPALLAALGLVAQPIAESKLVFAHYMVGSINDTDHVRQDVDQAISVGFDAFALNVGHPAESWAVNTVQQLFDYTKDKSLKLFFSFDFHQTGDINAHKTLFAQFRDHPAHLTYGPDSLPVVSSFGGGSLGPDTWKNFKQADKVYLLPNLDDDENYYKDTAAFFSTWGDAVDGVFSWETSWPTTSETPVNVSSVQDERVKAAADADGKAYVMGLSPLQYKHCCDDSWYRAGETNLPERMDQILSVSPEFVEFITWNDAGESHYIGPCWTEGLSADILEYGNWEKNPHDGWQALVASFIDVFKAGEDTSAMVPRDGNSFAGAMWYRSVTRACGGDVPRGAGAAVDAVNYAVVLRASGGPQTIRVTSGGQVIADGLPAGPGLNYNSIAGLRTGAQKIELLDATGAVVASATGSVDVSDGPNEYGFCDYNYFVAGLR